MALLLILTLGWGRAKAVTIQGDSSSAAAVTTIVKEQTKGWLSGNLLLMDNAKLAERVRAARPEKFAQVSIKRNLLKREITVVIETRSPLIYWLTGKEEYGVDEEGIAVNRAVGPPDLPYVVDKTNLPVEVGKGVASASFMGFIKEIIHDLKPKTGLSFQSGYVEETTTELFVNTNRGFYVRFDTSTAAADQLTAVSSVLKLHPAISRYIDVRLPYKAYYR